MSSNIEWLVSGQDAAYSSSIVLTQDPSSGMSRVAIVADSERTRFVIRVCAAFLGFDR